MKRVFCFRFEEHGNWKKIMFGTSFLKTCFKRQSPNSKKRQKTVFYLFWFPHSCFPKTWEYHDSTTIKTLKQNSFRKRILNESSLYIYLLWRRKLNVVSNHISKWMTLKIETKKINKQKTMQIGLSLTYPLLCFEKSLSCFNFLSRTKTLRCSTKPRN